MKCDGLHEKNANRRTNKTISLIYKTCIAIEVHRGHLHTFHYKQAKDNNMRDNVNSDKTLTFTALYVYPNMSKCICFIWVLQQFKIYQSLL